MAYKTIYNNIKESRYKYQYGRLTFYFSSEFYLEKFRKNLNQVIKTETEKLKIKFSCNIIADEMILLSYYKKLEKRGYRVYIETEAGNQTELDYYYTVNSEVNELSF